MDRHGNVIRLVFFRYAQNPLTIDLHQAATNNGIEVYNRTLTLIEETSYKGIRLSKAEGEGVAWLKGVEPAPDPNAWVKVRIVVEGPTVKTYINGAAEPSLVVEKVNRIQSGLIGFYVADTSGGDFANISITKLD